MAISLIAPRGIEGLPFDLEQLERVILTLADRYDIRLSVEAAASNVGLTVGLAVAGGLLGLYLGGRLGMLVGTVGGAGTAVFISLRQAWDRIRPQVVELYYIVYNYLRSLNVADYMALGQMLYNVVKNQERLVWTMLEFLATKVGTAVISSLDDNTRGIQ